MMKRKFVDTTIYAARKMETDGNIDRFFWHDKTPQERLRAAARMIEVAFGEPAFIQKKVDRTIHSIRKRNF